MGIYTSVNLEAVKTYQSDMNMAFTNINSAWFEVGNRVISLKTKGFKVNVDATNLAPGVYLTNIETELDTKTKKIIKQ